MLHNPEYRLKARSSQDRSVKHKNYARTTDKGFPRGRIYSLVLCNNLNETQVETKAPHILTYGLEGLEGLRVGNSDALEVRVGALMYGARKTFSNGLGTLEADNKAQAKLAA